MSLSTRPALRALPNFAVSASSTRTFTTSPALARQIPSHLRVPEEKVPDYPFAPFYTYKQRNSGLYARSKIQFGNVVAPKWFNKSRRHWGPNRQMKRFWSQALQAFIRTRVTVRVLRTIDKLGGIDEYLLGTKTGRIRDLGPAGWKLRWKVMQSPVVQEKWAKEREALGLPPREEKVELSSALLAEGLTAEQVESEVDEMLARDDEFILGEVTPEELAAAKSETRKAPEAPALQ